MAESKGKPSMNVELIRHMIFNNLKNIRNKQSKIYGELVICYDCPRSWRKKVFPEYKESRKKERKNSDFDWKALFDLMKEIQTDLTENFPYKVISVDNCEADDVIATLAINFSKKEKVLIVSSDGDFQQLQKYENIDQYSPTLKKMMHCEDPYEYLFEHIVRGDSSDGVPNILSPDDIFLRESVRQSAVSKKRYDTWLSAWKNSGTTNRDIFSISEDPDVRKNINRNIVLIDFDSIPQDLKQRIMDSYNQTQTPGRSKILNYFVSKRMQNLIQYATEF